MKIKTLIKKLEKILLKHGNIDATCWPYDGQQSPSKIESIEIFTKKEEKPIVIINN